MAFDIRKYLENNKIELGKYETTESHNVAKGVSDIRKTQHEVHIVDGKFQLDTLKKVIVEAKSSLTESINIPIIWIAPTKTYDYFGRKLTIRKGETGLIIARDNDDVFLVEFQKVRFYATWHTQFEGK